MADALNDPLKSLREEQSDHAQHESGSDSEVDASGVSQPTVGTDPQDPGSLGVEKPTVSLDPAAVNKAEKQGKGF